MSVLVIGGDRLGNITHKLSEYGFSDIHHVTGRKAGDRRLIVPENTDLIVVLTDFVEHQLTEVIKKESKRKGVQITFSKRSWSHMQKNIEQCLGIQ